MRDLKRSISRNEIIFINAFSLVCSIIPQNKLFLQVLEQHEFRNKPQKDFKKFKNGELCSLFKLK